MEKIKNVNSEKYGQDDPLVRKSISSEQQIFFREKRNHWQDLEKKDNSLPFSTLFLARENNTQKEEKEEKTTPNPYLMKPSERISARKRRRQIHRQLLGRLERPPLTFGMRPLGGKKKSYNDFLKTPPSSQRAFQYSGNLRREP